MTADRRLAPADGAGVAGAGLDALQLVLVRHGQTQWNAEARYQGHRDIPLSATGAAQAAALASYMSQWDVAAVYSSDLSRAFETASRIAAAHGITVLRDRRLREMCFGDWESLTHDEIESNYPDLYGAWLESPATVHPPNGETLADVRDRALAALRDAVRAWSAGATAAGEAGRDARTVADRSGRPVDGQGTRIVVVCHGGPIRAVLCTVLGLPLDQGFWRLGARPGTFAVLRGDTRAWRRFVSAGAAGEPETACCALDVETMDALPE
ncbi:MAG: histidine phosphatase family protein [Firmicutes bacterium]|nr:histidine phosphatase family protein [Bacillota bacterium]